MTFRVEFTADFFKAGTTDPVFSDIDVTTLEVPGVECGYLADAGGEIVRGQLAQADAVVVLGPSVTAASVEEAEHLAVVARIGVGYDAVDVEACTRESIALTITPAGVRRPVASAALTFLLALAHRLPLKDRLTREGRWSEKAEHMGIGLRGRTLGLIGMGNIGTEILRLVAPLEMRTVVADPFAKEHDVNAAGADLLALPQLLETADFVIICCALTSETRHLIGMAELTRMKQTAHLINIARGPIIDQSALTQALQEQIIAGAALDVFEQEPIESADRLLSLDNVILAPHALAWTDESFRLMGESAFTGILAASEGRAPDHVVNRDVLDTARFKEKLTRCAARRSEETS